MKNIAVVILLLLIYGCGYTSVYKNQIFNDIMISLVDIQGDEEINNLVKDQLSLVSDSKSTNVYKISFKSNYEKITIAKNSAGIATDYKLTAVFDFNINKNGINRNIKLSENFNIKNTNENFEQTSYERSIKRNFAISIKNKLLQYMINLR